MNYKKDTGIPLCSISKENFHLPALQLQQLELKVLLVVLNLLKLPKPKIRVQARIGKRVKQRI